MDRATFWATKCPLPEFHGIVFEHPAFSGPIRLVANQFREVTLGGHVHTPSSMVIKAPDRKSESQPKLTLSFARQVAGREFKRQLALVRAAPQPAPIRVTYSVYLGGTAMPEVVWRLYVSEKNGITFSNESVQVAATVDNPMRRDVGPTYDPSVFTGLELL